jgi:hypothetical protein
MGQTVAAAFPVFMHRIGAHLAADLELRDA